MIAVLRPSQRFHVARAERPARRDAAADGSERQSPVSGEAAPLLQLSG